MLEDFTMEKKPSGRVTQVPGKASGSELKKSQDAVSNKPFPRYLRRRESYGTSSNKFDPNRKPAPQKNKSFDKRPRPRGQSYGCGKESAKIADEEEAELGSVFVPGSKKQNLNHLLNFHYAPREGTVPHWKRNVSARWLSYTHKHKYNKEQFLQANCQFVVKADGNYTPYTSDPDTLVHWDLIEQIRLQSSEVLSCPICLYPPVAAKMTRCGHVFCWPCILHYLALSDKAWRKCPICYEAVHKHDLRSVIAIPHMQLSVGEEVTMLLMKRERGSLVALPVGQCGIRPTSQLLSVSETAVNTVHSKLLLATPREVMSIVDHERQELEKQLSEEENRPETCFIEQAIGLLGERRAELTSKLELCGNYQPAVVYEYSCVEEAAVASEGQQDQSGPQTSRSRYESMSSEGFGSDDGNAAFTVEDLEIHQLHVGQLGSPPLKHFYFYQAADGQHTYLHALNVRMLERCYGSLEHCPPVVTGRIVEKESGSMTEELRHRLRYLQHLPVTCQFEVAEIQLKPPIVTKETMEHFRDQIDVRRRRRQRRARDERRREKKIMEEENRRWGRYPTPHIRIESHRHFPQCGIECEDPTIESLSVSPVESSVASSPTPCDSISPLSVAAENLSISEECALSSHNSSESPGMSFAQMLREGKSKGCGEWSNGAKMNRKPADRPHNSDSEPEPEGYVPAPTFSQSFSDAIAVALEKVVANRESAKDGDSCNSGKKKKKQKQKVLFATSMACSGK